MPLTAEEKIKLAEYNDVRDAMRQYPNGSAIRGQLEKRCALLEAELGL